jgi:hypothetical protein
MKVLVKDRCPLTVIIVTSSRLQLLVRSVHDSHGYDMSPRRCYVPFLTAGAPTWPERGLKDPDSMSGLCNDIFTPSPRIHPELPPTVSP